MNFYIKKIFFFFFLLISLNALAENKSFYLGVQSYPETEMKIDEISINDIIRNLFKNELKLDVKEVNATWRELYKYLEDGEIDALGLVSKNNIGKENILLSEPIFSENLYVSSEIKKIESYSDLENQNIYVYKNDTLPLKYLKEYLKKNKVNANIKEVNDLENYKNEIYLDSELTIKKSKNRLLVSFLAPVCIGINKRYEYLIPVINNALNKKYRKEINNYLKKRPLYFQRQRFQSSLTEDERKYLTHKKYLTTSLENNSALSIYLKKSDKYIGIVPEYINLISKIIDIPIKYINVYEESSDEKKQIDFFILPKIGKKLIYIYSETIDSIPMYLLNHVDNFNYNVGVIKGDKSQEIGEKYFLKEDIKLYKSKAELLSSFKNKKIGYIITPYIGYDWGCIENHKDVKISDFPINFAFTSDKKILKNIFDKAILSLGEIDKKNIRDLVEKEEKEYYLSIEKRLEQERGLIYLVVITLIILVIIVFFQKRLTKSLKFDQLTKLPNRYLFNEFCKNNSYKEGIVVVIDLDNFKKVNDKFGHIKGDLVLCEVGKILLNIFLKKYVFRISGDEFYLFYNDINILEKLNSLVENGKHSVILDKYNVSFSIGYYIKKNAETLEKAFEKADIAMYEAKKIKGFTFVKYNEE